MAEQAKHGSKRYSREFRLQAARLVVEGGYSYARAAGRQPDHHGRPCRGSFRSEPFSQGFSLRLRRTAGALG